MTAEDPLGLFRAWLLLAGLAFVAGFAGYLAIGVMSAPSARHKPLANEAAAAAWAETPAART